MAQSTLKLAALDEQDLKVVSAHVQDAVLKVEDIKWLSADSRFVVAMNRFVWEKKPRLFRPGHERRRSVLQFDKVRAVKSHGVDPADRQDVLSLLAVVFEPSNAPAGTIDLIFSGEARVRLEVEYIEARLTDLGAAWETRSRPDHRS